MNEIEVAFLRVLSAGGSSVAFSTWKMGKITRSIWKWKVSRLVGRMWGTIGPCEDDGKGLENSALHCTGKQSGDWREEGMKKEWRQGGWAEGENKKKKRKARKRKEISSWYSRDLECLQHSASSSSSSCWWPLTMNTRSTSVDQRTTTPRPPIYRDDNIPFRPIFSGNTRSHGGFWPIPPVIKSIDKQQKNLHTQTMR